MGSRINWKFIIILALALFVAGGLLGGMYYLKLRDDPLRNVTRGDEFFAQGDYENAMDQYGRAVGKEPGNPTYLDKLEDSLTRITPTTRDRSRELYQSYVSVLRHDARYHPQNPEPHLRLLETLHRDARISGLSGQWQMVAGAADDMMARVHNGDEKHSFGRLYRGIAYTQTPLRTTLADDDIQQGREDLAIFVEEHPDNDLGWASLIMANLTDASSALNEQDLRGYDEIMNDVNRQLRDAKREVPNGIHVARAELLAVWFDYDQNRDEEREEALRAAVDRLLSVVNEEEDIQSWELDQIVSVLRGLREREYVVAAADLVRRHLENHPEDALQRLGLVRTLRSLGDDESLEEAKSHANQVLNMEAPAVSFMSMFQYELRANAANFLADQAFREWDKATNDPQAEADAAEQALQDLEDAKERLVELVLDRESDRRLIETSGKIAYAKGDFAEAATKFEELIVGGERLDTQTLMIAAICQEKLGNVGRAYQHINTALTLRPQSPDLLYYKGRFELLLGRRNDAAATVESLLEILPDNERVQQLAQSVGSDGAGRPSLSVQTQQLLSEDKTDEARAMLLAEVESDSEQKRDALILLIGLEFSEQRRDEAAEYLAIARQQWPNDRRLLQLQAVLDNEDDAIESIRQYAESLQISDADKAMLLLSNYSKLEQRNRRAAESLEASGSIEEAATARDIANRAAEETKNYVAEVERLDPQNKNLFEYKFSDAVQNERWEEAERMIEEARARNIDNANGQFYRGRYLIVRGKDAEAASVLSEAAAMTPFKASVWRTLGFARERSLDFAGARAAYEEAYELQPTDVGVVSAYVRLLERAGERIRALDIIRDAHAAAPRSSSIRDSWLNLEYAVGDRVVALKTRQDIHKSEPENQANSLRLADMLGTTEPTRALILDENGEPRYSAVRWTNLSASEREKVIAEQRSDWQTQADAIVDELAEQDLDPQRLALLRASLLRSRNDFAGGERVLRDYIAAKPESELTSQDFSMLAGFLTSINRQEKAVEVLESALDYQDESVREIDAALGDTFFQLGRNELAIEHLQEVYEVRGDRTVKERIVEAMLRLGRLGEAEAELDALVKRDGVNFTTWMLFSAIAEQRGREFTTEGQSDEAAFSFARMDEALNNAQQLDPKNPAPMLQRARHKIWLGSTTNNIAAFDDAARILDRAESLRPDYDRISLTRVDLLNARGDQRGAIGELSRFVEANPANVEARAALYRLHLAQNNLDGAERVLRRAVEIDPNATEWAEQLGDFLRTRRQDLQGAADVYSSIARRAPSPSLVAKLAEVLLTVGTQGDDAMRLLESHEQWLEQYPILMLQKARAHAQLGEDESATTLLREGYRLQKEVAGGAAPGAQATRQWFVAAGEVLDGDPERLQAFVMELSNQQPSFHQMRGLVSAWAAQGEEGLNRAIALQEEVIAQTPPDKTDVLLQLHSDLAGYYVRLGNYESAAKSFKVTADLSPDNPAASNNYAYVLTEFLDQPSKALPYAQAAVEKAPDTASFLDTLGWTYFKIGDYDQAENYLRRSIKIEENPAALIHLAEVLRQAGRYEEATVRLQRALAIGPDAETAAEIQAMLDDIRTKSPAGR